MDRYLLGGTAVGVTANVVAAENALMPTPPKVMVATDILYTTLGTKPFSATLVLGVYTVMGELPVSLFSWCTVVPYHIMHSMARNLLSNIPFQPY